MWRWKEKRWKIMRRIVIWLIIFNDLDKMEIVRGNQFQDIIKNRSNRNF